MATRYSGDLKINVTYDDHNFYRTSVSRSGKLLWRGIVKPAPAGFGPGVSYDSPQAYDEVASSALSFADDEVGGIGDTADYDENLTGYLIRRAAPAKTTKTASHATRKSTKAAGPVGNARMQFDNLMASRSSSPAKWLTVAAALRSQAAKSEPGYRVVLIDRAELAEDRAAKLSRQGASAARSFHATRSSTARETKPQIVVRKVEGRWQPLTASGVIIRGNVYNADGTGYSTKQGAEEAAMMIRKLGKTA